MTGRIVAVVPFGARVAGSQDTDRERRPGAWARQIARRLVEHFPQDSGVELRPVFLVTVPGTGDDARSSAAGEPGYLIFGSTPDPALASEYARSLEAGHSLTGTYHETGAERRLEVSLIDAATATVTASLDHTIGPGELQLAEGELAVWLASALNVTARGDLRLARVANEDAYAALLEAMDAEVDVTLLRTGDERAARGALETASSAYVRAVLADPGSALIEDRVLVLGATAIEHDEQAVVLPALEALSEARPSSWRAHYMLAEVRRTSGDSSGAVVAFEHADALQPLRDADLLSLARLYAASGAASSAVSRLRRIVRRGSDKQVVAGARRLMLSLQHPELERVLEEAGRIAVEGDLTRAAEAEAGFESVLDLDDHIWEAHFGRALLALQRGDAAGASASFERALDLNPAASALIEGLGRG